MRCKERHLGSLPGVKACNLSLRAPQTYGPCELPETERANMSRINRLCSPAPGNHTASLSVRLSMGTCLMVQTGLSLEKLCWIRVRKKFFFLSLFFFFHLYPASIGPRIQEQKLILSRFLKAKLDSSGRHGLPLAHLFRQMYTWVNSHDLCSCPSALWDLFGIVLLFMAQCCHLATAKQSQME